MSKTSLNAPSAVETAIESMASQDLQLRDRPLTARALPARRLIERLFDRLPAVPLTAALGCLALLLVRLPRILQGENWNTDVAWSKVLIEDFSSGPKGGRTYVGVAAHYTTLAFLFLTRPLPFHRFIWDLSPYLTSMAALGLIVWACWKVAGQWAALLTLSIGLMANPDVLWTTLAMGLRVHSVFASAALVAGVVFLSFRGLDLSRKSMSAWALGLGLLSGVTLGSDPLFLLSGILPFVGAAGVGWLACRTSRARSLLFIALGALVVGLISAAAISHFTYDLGFRKTHMNDGFVFALPKQALVNAAIFAVEVLTLGNGYFFGERVGLASLGSLLVSGLVVAAFFLPFVLTFLEIRNPGREQSHTLIVYLAFWALTELGIATAFITTTVASGWGRTTIRYLVPIFFAMAAVVPVWSKRLGWRRVLGASGVTLFGLLSIVSMGSLLNYRDLESYQQMRPILSYLEGQGLHRGYAGYWGSHQYTLFSGQRVRVYPTYHCEGSLSNAICPFYVNIRTAWFRQDRKEKTFLIVDPTQKAAALRGPLPQFGPPASEKRFGQIDVLIFDYDIASRFKFPHVSGSD